MKNAILQSDEQLLNVTAARGTSDGKQPWEYNFPISLPTYVHRGCGGEIIRGDIIHKCVCQKCKKAYYFLSSFDYYEVNGINPPEIPAGY